MVDQSFVDRLNRIETGKQIEPDGVLFQQRQKRKGKTKAQKRKQVAGNALYPLSIAGAFVLGLLVVVLARYVRFQLFGMDPANGDVMADQVAMDAVLSSAFGFVLRQATNLKSPLHLSAKGFGITAAVLTMHMAVHRFPELWAMLFSPEWVQAVITSTEPDSILILSFED